MPYVGKKPADIIATAVDTTTGTFSGVVDADAGITVDNITIDGTEIDLSSGDLTIDVAGDIILDADGGDIKLKDGSTIFGELTNNAGADGNLDIRCPVSDADIRFKGVDGGANVTALLLDMSDAGTAVFNHNVRLATDNAILNVGNDDDIALTHNGTNGSLTSGGNFNLAIGTDLTLDAGGDITVDADSGNIYFKDGGTGFGAISNVGGDATIYSTAGNHKGLRFGNAQIVPTNNAGADSDNTTDLGGTSNRFKNLYLSGGVVFGSTGGAVTSKTLDDYEEGTFTPTLALSNATLTSSGGTGRYTKIGRHVYVEGEVTRATASGASSGVVQIESLPFTSLNANSINVMGSGTIWMDEGGPSTNQGDTVGHAYVPSNTARAEIVRGTSSGAQTSARYGIGSEMSNGRPLYFNFAYTTA